MLTDPATLLAQIAPVFGLCLTTTGLCFLGLWSVRLIQPAPRCAASLLLVSAGGAFHALSEVAPGGFTTVHWLPFVAAPLLTFVALFTLLGQEAPSPPR
jgi:hypothetical protein